jgi:hypothetical protein
VDISIEHDEANRNFFCEVDAKTCSVHYERHDTIPVVLDIYKTFVHPELRGKGIAESLLKRITEYAISQGFTIQPSCSFAVLYFRKHREYAPVLAKDVDLHNGGSCRL